MRKLLWLLVLAIPPWIAVELDAAKWIKMLAVAPLFLLAMTLDDHPDEHLLGEGLAQYRPSILVILGIGGLILGAALLLLVRTLL